MESFNQRRLVEVAKAIVPRMGDLYGEAAFGWKKKAQQQARKSDRPVIETEIGQCAFPIPSQISTYMKQAIDNGCTGYTPAQGLEDALVEYAHYLTTKTGTPVKSDEILFTSGAKPGITATLALLINEGDGVAMPELSYPIYPAMTQFLEGTIHYLSCRPENRFHIDIDEFRRIAPKTRVLVLTYPHNPTGAVLSREEMEQLAEIVLENDMYVLCDEPYNEIYFGAEAPFSFFSIPGMDDRTFVTQSISKTFVFPAARGGCLRAPKLAISPLTTFLSNIYSCPSAYVQQTVAWTLADLRQGEPWVTEWLVGGLRQRLNERREVLLNGLQQLAGIKCYNPEGAFYLWIYVGRDGLAFTNQLLEQQNLCVLPGDSFGSAGREYIRICFGISAEDAIEIPGRIEKSLKQ